jgi:hypothetical protein
VRFLGWLSVSVLQRGVEAALTEGSITSPSRNGPAASRWFARLQSGNLQAYLVYALIGLALVLGWGAAHV